MNRYRHALTMVVLAISPALALGQASGESGGKPGAGNTMYEDIAIMSRILSRQLHDRHQAFCGSCHRPAFGGEGSGAGSAQMLWSALGRKAQVLGESRPADPKVQGTYLKGYGIVFNVSIVPLPESAATPKPAAKTASAWEQTKKELRGEKSAAKPASSQVSVPNLNDLILKMLADNGHNFSQLTDNEKLTVVVNFEGSISDVHSMAHPGDPFWQLGESNRDRRALEHWLGVTPSGKVTSARDYQLLGDLQYKQGRFQEALQAYQKAVELNPERQQLAEIYRKLAETILGLEKTSKNASHDQVIARAMEFLKRAQEAQTDTKQQAPAKVVASKLIISVPKTALDEVASGRLGFDGFRGYASIERVNVAAPQKKDDTMK